MTPRRRDEKEEIRFAGSESVFVRRLSVDPKLTPSSFIYFLSVFHQPPSLSRFPILSWQSFIDGNRSPKARPGRARRSTESLVDGAEEANTCSPRTRLEFSLRIDAIFDVSDSGAFRPDQRQRNGDIMKNGESLAGRLSRRAELVAASRTEKFAAPSFASCVCVRVRTCDFPFALASCHREKSDGKYVTSQLDRPT